ncbi:hypothetical protein HNR23_003905 [Nocardiopsis mwathae]|uniref:Uncharacterized protein n=1 Tax=Nocardiopsis mwathae TaxID=1472723 RepID=A0A7W9YKH2_9ACTN|nr:hypothetical protein [Nocardiopsis mwathae]MBB6173845.1 hypothetical protein [Nocardiopsis mwathae]
MHPEHPDPATPPPAPPYGPPNPTPHGSYPAPPPQAAYQQHPHMGHPHPSYHPAHAAAPYGTPHWRYPANLKPPGTVTAARVLMFIQGALTLGGALLAFIASLVGGSQAIPGSDDASLALFVGAIGAVGLLMGAASITLGVLAGKRSTRVMWTIAGYHALLVALAISAIVMEPRNPNALLVLTTDSLILGFTLSKTSRLYYQSGKANPGTNVVP